MNWWIGSPLPLYSDTFLSLTNFLLKATTKKIRHVLTLFFTSTVQRPYQTLPLLIKYPWKHSQPLQKSCQIRRCKHREKKKCKKTDSNDLLSLIFYRPSHGVGSLLTLKREVTLLQISDSLLWIHFSVASESVLDTIISHQSLYSPLWSLLRIPLRFEFPPFYSFGLQQSIVSAFVKEVILQSAGMVGMGFLLPARWGGLLAIRIESRAPAITGKWDVSSGFWYSVVISSDPLQLPAFFFSSSVCLLIRLVFFLFFHVLHRNTFYKHFSSSLRSLHYQGCGRVWQVLLFAI